MAHEAERREIRKQLDAEGVTAVRRKHSVGFCWRERHHKWATEWLRDHEKQEQREQAERKQAESEAWYANVIMIVLTVIGIAAVLLLAR